MIWEERVALAQLFSKVPIGYNGTPQIHPQNCPFPFDDHRQNLIHPYQAQPHSPPQTVSGSNHPFCHSSYVQTGRWGRRVFYSISAPLAMLIESDALIIDSCQKRVTYLLWNGATYDGEIWHADACRPYVTRGLGLMSIEVIVAKKINILFKFSNVNKQYKLAVNNFGLRMVGWSTAQRTVLPAQRNGSSVKSVSQLTVQLTELGATGP